MYNIIYFGLCSMFTLAMLCQLKAKFSIIASHISLSGISYHLS